MANLSDLMEERRWLVARLERIDAEISANGHAYQEPIQQRATAPEDWILAPTPIRRFEAHLEEFFKKMLNPLKRGPILKHLEDSGVVIPGPDPANTLGSRLNRILWITNIKGFGYWHSLRDYPPADYSAQKQLEQQRMLVEILRKRT